MMKFLFATGGTGGHLFPALKTALELRKRGHEVFFLGSFGLGIEKIQAYGFPLKNLEHCGANFNNPFKIIKFCFLMIKALMASIFFLKDFKPDVVAGFGGYGSFPGVCAAILLRYPSLIHEQNVLPGKANKILAGYVSRIAISFRKSSSYFQREKTVLTGCPCHSFHGVSDKAEILEEFHLQQNKKTILVFGGSQGSHRLNEEFLKAVILMKGQIDFQVIHICGKNDYLFLEKSYAELKIPFALFRFLDRMDYAYSLADLVIARAGAATVSEIAIFRVPAILVPYPYAQEHQKANAEILREVNLAEVIEEKDLTPERFKEEILRGLSLGRRRQAVFDASELGIFLNAAEHLAGEIEQLGHVDKIF